MPLTSIVMLTRNGLDLTRRCVESVQRHTTESVEWIVVDNGSTDGTLEFWNSIPGVRLIANEENKGFAAGTNQGMLQAKGDYILLLNNDTIVTPNWLSTLFAPLHRDSSIGIVGPVSDNIAPIQKIPDVERPSLKNLDAYALQRQHDLAGSGFYAHRLIGFCMLFHRGLLDRIGGFDERYFPGNFEDDDFSIRARISGKNLWVAQDVFIHHAGQGTFRSNRINYQRSALVGAENFREKWSVELSPLELVCRGYNPSDIVAREPIFIPERHFVPLEGIPLQNK